MHMELGGLEVCEPYYENSNLHACPAFCLLNIKEEERFKRGFKYKSGTTDSFISFLGSEGKLVYNLLQVFSPYEL